jgi:nucleotide-binding universal stress UspA family protein
MYERILVPLDGSALAEQVLPYVEPLAERFGSTIILLRAAPPPGTIIAGTAAGAGTVAGPIVDPTPLVEAEQQEAATYLEQVANRLRGRGLAVQCEEPVSPAGEAIAEQARRLRADLIAMTTHGRGGLARLVLGSVADKVMRSAPCPVLLVRASEERAGGRS